MLLEQSNPMLDLLDLYVWREDGNYHAPANYMTTDQRVELFRQARGRDQNVLNFCVNLLTDYATNSQGWLDLRQALIEECDRIWNKMGDSDDRNKSVDSPKSLKQNDVAPMGE